MREVFVGEFSEDDVLFGRKRYADSLRKIVTENPNYKSIRMALVEQKGNSYYFRKLKVFLVLCG